MYIKKLFTKCLFYKTLNSNSNVLNSKFIAQTRYNNNDVCKFVPSPKLTCSKLMPQSSKFGTLKQ